MTDQREKAGISPAQLNVTLGLPADTPCIVSGGMIENFREGWAKDIMSRGKVGHYFTRNQDFTTTTAECGVEALTRWIYGIGNYGRCKNCERALRMISRNARLISKNGPVCYG